MQDGSRDGAWQRRPNLGTPHPSSTIGPPPRARHSPSHRIAPFEQTARLRRASVASGFPPAPRSMSGENKDKNPPKETPEKGQL
jgi:hypothetical protein